MKKKTILITGSTGFIGKNLTAAYRTDYHVLTPTHTQLDMADGPSVDAYFRSHAIDIVIHCANVGEFHNVTEYRDSVEQNVKMVVHLARNQARFGRLIHFGSGAEYDKSLPLKLKTESQLGTSIPTDAYGLSKYVCTLLVRSVPNHIILRPFAVFGQHENYSRRFISNMICRSIVGMPMIINKNVYYDYLYVQDLVTLVPHFFSRTFAHTEYNVGSGVRVDLITIARAIQQVTGVRDEIIVQKPGMQPEYTCSVDRLQDTLGTAFVPTPLEAAIEALYSWYKRRKRHIDRSVL